MEPLQKLYLDCQCECLEHVIRLQYDPENGDINLDVHLTMHEKWYQRVWLAIRYVFGFRSKFGEYDCTMLKVTDYVAVRKMMRRSEKFHEKAKTLKVLKGGV